MKYITPGGRSYVHYKSMLNQPHLLIAGATGSGKSVLINGLISTAMLDSPAVARFVLLDPKTTELHQWASAPHVMGYSYETPDMLASLRSAIDIMETRLRHMHAVGERIWTGSDVYVIIDEMADLLLTAKTEAVPLLQRLCQLGRAAGVHCIGATQCLLASVLPTQVRCNFSSVVCLRTATKQQSRFICDRTGAELFPSPAETGKAKAFYRTGADCREIDLYKVPDAEQQRLINYWTSPACIVA